MKRIVFIAGSWRSGSTLLGDLLGAAPGFHHVGELHHFWGRGLHRNWRCGCGELFRSCPFWSRVIRGWGEGAPEEARQLDETRRSLAALGRDATPERIAVEYPKYVDAVRRVTDAVFEASDASIVVDSSKSLRHGCALLADPLVELLVVHLVRDPRATAFSLVHRAKQRLDDPEGSSMLTYDVDRAVSHWLGSNFEAARLGELASGYCLLRYEDLAREPAAWVGGIVEAASSAAAPDDALGEARLAASHTLSGNPDRLRAEARSEIRLDDEWTTGLDQTTQDHVVERTRDWMQRYGYV